MLPDKTILDDKMSITDREFRQLRDFIHAHTGIALSEHKRALVCSRLAKRLRYHGLNRYADYYSLLTVSDPQEQELMAMINAITTNKTDFFREPHHFEFLATEFFPAHRRNPQRPKPLRIWSAGSSSGEEAYSIAMTALETMSPRTDQDVLILASDIDTDMLAHAESGVYSMEQAAQIPEDLLHRYFLRGEGEYDDRVMAKPVLKSLVRFRRLNLMEEPWPMQEPFDIIFCRNVIIYFDKPTQQRLFRRFAGNLKKDGFLMLGHSEGLHGFADSFRTAGHSIYQYKGTIRP